MCTSALGQNEDPLGGRNKQCTSLISSERGLHAVIVQRYFGRTQTEHRRIDINHGPFASAVQRHICQFVADNHSFLKCFVLSYPRLPDRKRGDWILWLDGWLKASTLVSFQLVTMPSWVGYQLGDSGTAGITPACWINRFRQLLAGNRSRCQWPGSLPRIHLSVLEMIQRGSGSRRNLIASSADDHRYDKRDHQGSGNSRRCSRGVRPVDRPFGGIDLRPEMMR